MSSKCHFKMKCYWGLECAALDNCSQFSWIELYEGVTEGTLWTRSCLEQQHIVSYPFRAALSRSHFVVGHGNYKGVGRRRRLSSVPLSVGERTEQFSSTSDAHM